MTSRHSASSSPRSWRILGPAAAIGASGDAHLRASCSGTWAFHIGLEQILAAAAARKPDSFHRSKVAPMLKRRRPLQAHPARRSGARGRGERSQATTERGFRREPIVDLAGARDVLAALDRSIGDWLRETLHRWSQRSDRDRRWRPRRVTRMAQIPQGVAIRCFGCGYDDGRSTREISPGWCRCAISKDPRREVRLRRRGLSWACETPRIFPRRQLRQPSYIVAFVRSGDRQAGPLLRRRVEQARALVQRRNADCSRNRRGLGR